MTDKSSMYLMGRHNGRASIIKFDKRIMDIQWRLDIHSNLANY